MRKRKQRLQSRKERRLLVQKLEHRHLLAAGDLDLGFGTGGIVGTDFGGDDLISQPSGVAIHTDGTIVAVGQRDGADFNIAKYQANGSPDLSFAGTGKVTTDLGAADDRAMAVVIQTDGKPVVGGRTGGKPVLIRYNLDGTLDAGFGTGGVVILADVTPDQGDKFTDLVIQPDGMIVGSINGDFGIQMTVARVDADGNLDTSFAGDGIADISFLPGGSTEFANSIALQNDGMIVVAGRVKATSPDVAVARLQSNGAPDSGFGTNGEVQTDFGGSENASDVELQSDGSIVVGGSKDANEAALWRYTSSGALDGNFAATPALGADSAIYSIEINDDNEIIAAMPFHTSGDFCLARFQPDGSLDSGFGTAGIVSHDLGSTDQAFSIKLQADGRIIAAGNSGDSPDRDFALTRYGDGFVVSPEQQIEQIVQDVQALLDDDTLSNGEANPPLNFLDQALKDLSKGKTSHAVKKLNDFIERIEDLIDDEELPEEIGQALINDANAAIASVLA